MPMLNLDDFTSWGTIIPAALALLAAGMSWRGLHISGDAKHARLWGGLSVLTFLLALLGGAIAHHEAADDLRQANKDAADSKRALQDIQDSLAALRHTVAPEGASTDDVLSAAVERLQSQQAELADLMGKLEAMKRASRLDNHFYQDSKDTAAIVADSFDQKTGTLHLKMLTAQQPFDFGKEIESQKARIRCDPKQPNTSAVVGADMNLTYYDVTCHVLGPIQ